MCLDRPEWTADDRQTRREAAQACQHCPVIRECRDYAARHTWHTVAIAGWVAGRSQPAHPPWYPAEPDRL